MLLVCSMIFCESAVRDDLDWRQLEADRRQAGDCCCAVSCSTARHHLCPSLGTAGACNTIQSSRTPYMAAWLAEEPGLKSASTPSVSELMGHLMRLVMLMYAGMMTCNTGGQ